MTDERDESVQPVPNHWAAYKIRHPKKRAFLSAYVQSGTITHAAEAADIARTWHYKWKAEDTDYAAAFADAEDRYAEKLEREADRRAVEGTLKPVFWHGHEVGAIREFSDVLLIFRLKGLRPETYKERRENEHTGKRGGPLRIVIEDDDDSGSG